MNEKSASHEAGPSLSGLRTRATRWDLALINGPNMSNLGRRDPRTYGSIASIEELHDLMGKVAAGLGVSMRFFVSNHEGAILEFIHDTSDAIDGYLINPGGLWGMGEATRDALRDSRRPFVEVHFANLSAGGLISLFTKDAAGSVMGMRQYGYVGGLLSFALTLDAGYCFNGDPEYSTRRAFTQEALTPPASNTLIEGEPMKVSDLRKAETVWEIVLIDGPNMSNLGRRDQRIYGSITSINELHKSISGFASCLGVNLRTFMSNYEGAILEFIHEIAEIADGYIINPSGLTSVGESTRHALQETRRPVVEVHFGNLAAGGISSIFSRTVMGVFMGMRQYGYLGALLALVLGLDDETFLGHPEQPTEANRRDGVPWAFHGR